MASRPGPRARAFCFVSICIGSALVLAGCFHGTWESEPFVDENGQPLGDSLRLRELASGLDRPTFAAGVGDGTTVVVEQAGTIRLLDDEGLRDDPVLDIEERVGSSALEQGLLGLAFAPDFPDDERVFLSYTDTNGDSVVSSFDADPGEGALRLNPDSEQVVLRLAQPYSNHNGGMIAFSPDGLLFVGFGDGGAGGDPEGHGQDPSTWLGSLLRLDVSASPDYEVPPDNPFVDDEEGAPEVWAYGLRNPWRFSFDRETGDLWIGDVGQGQWEEVNHVPAGEGAGWNFGWNRFEGEERYANTPAEDPVSPVAVYPIAGEDHCSVTGGYVYRGEAIPALQGTYLFGDWCSGGFWGLQEVEGEWEIGELMQTGRQLSSFAEDDSGEIILIDHSGAVLRLEEK